MSTVTEGLLRLFIFCFWGCIYNLISRFIFKCHDKVLKQTLMSGKKNNKKILREISKVDNGQSP